MTNILSHFVEHSRPSLIEITLKFKIKWQILPCAVLDGLNDTIDCVTVCVDDNSSVLIAVDMLELGTRKVVGIGVVIPEWKKKITWKPL